MLKGIISQNMQIEKQSKKIFLNYSHINHSIFSHVAHRQKGIMKLYQNSSWMAQQISLQRCGTIWGLCLSHLSRHNQRYHHK